MMFFKVTDVAQVRTMLVNTPGTDLKQVVIYIFTISVLGGPWNIVRQAHRLHSGFDYVV